MPIFPLVSAPISAPNFAHAMKQTSSMPPNVLPTFHCTPRNWLPVSMDTPGPEAHTLRSCAANKPLDEYVI